MENSVLDQLKISEAQGYTAHIYRDENDNLFYNGKPFHYEKRHSYMIIDEEDCRVNVVAFESICRTIKGTMVYK